MGTRNIHMSTQCNRILPYLDESTKDFTVARRRLERKAAILEANRRKLKETLERYYEEVTGLRLACDDAD